MPAPKKEKLEKALSNLSPVYKDIYQYKSFSFNYLSQEIDALIKIRVNQVANKPPVYLVSKDYKYISSLFLKEDNSLYFDYKVGDSPCHMYDIVLDKRGISVSQRE